MSSLRCQSQVSPDCCSPLGNCTLLPPHPGHTEFRGSSPSGAVPPPSLPRPPSWELVNLRTWAGQGLAQLALTLAQGLGFPSKSMGLAGLQRDN